MTVRVVVPYDAATPKTRLADVLTPTERAAFAEAMLGDVIESVRDAGGTPQILATAPVDTPAPVTVDERPLTPAVNDVLADATEPIAIVMADLALATPDSLRHLFDATADIVLAPGLGGGTNAVLVREPEFRVDYHDASIRDHRAIARDIGATIQELDSFRLATDIDDPVDLPEVLLHADGRATDWLAERFRIDASDGRVTVTRR